MGTEENEERPRSRAMELLWGVAPEPTRGPKRGLTVERIVGTAIRIADAEGLEAASMRRVADELGVGPMSLYTYVGRKDDLADLMTDAVVAELSLPDPPPQDWRAALELLAHEQWALYERHPWALSMTSTTRPQALPHGMAMTEWALEVFDGAGLDLPLAVELYLLLASYVQGLALQHAREREAERASGLTAAQWWQQHDPLFTAVITPERFPMIARLEESFASGADVETASQSIEDMRHRFQFGLKLVLDGIEKNILAHTG